MALHCAECGFVNPEGANYCQKCGALVDHEAGDEAATATYRVGETGDFVPVDLDDVMDDGAAALVIRAGGGRAGESFAVAGERMTIGRRPDSSVFLDDITVSRKHAVFATEGQITTVRDAGSLNGTYVNRERIDEAVLASGDEVQIGKFKLVYLRGAGE